MSVSTSGTGHGYLLVPGYIDPGEKVGSTLTTPCYVLTAAHVDQKPGPLFDILLQVLNYIVHRLIVLSLLDHHDVTFVW